MKSNYSISMRYANALISILLREEKLNNLPDYIGGLKKIIDKLKSDSDFYDLIMNPLLHPDYMTKKLAEVSEIQDEIFSLFLNSIVSKKRQNNLKMIYVALKNEYDRLNETIDVKIVNAQPVDEKILKSIEETVKKKTGKNIKVKSTLDNELIAGLQLLIGDKLFDYSIKGYLESLLSDTTRG